MDPAGVASAINTLPTDADTQNQAPTTTAKQLGPLDGELDFGNFAPATGGTAYFGRNDIGKQVGAAVAAGADYYTLSYRPSQASVDSQQYRRIRITVNDPALHVVSRDGYFGNAAVHVDTAPTPQGKSAQQLEYDLNSAARSRLAYTGIELAAARSKDGPGFIVRLRAANLQFRTQPDGALKAELTVLALFFDAKDKEVGHKALELKLGLAANRAADPRAVGGFDFPTDPPATAARVRFVVRDATTGLLGTADVTLAPAAK